ncbi:molecular chaperone DnaJ [Agaricicola taiwanensis]|uniref:Molecular chaperone DnaJ n=1 Tax=Agaricicola taiwanensis TaxID=591372 RepID=A0A8J2YFZ5_9RHOB|nr:J domain-containing protein [Agaricicola taiwanensis]GGE35781.1 molecular chaperone DnaJ [Agaricicola taiwanensis]
MTRNPYTVLGIDKSAGDADIKKAYRRLAKTLHPDRNPDDPKAQERFAELTSAYDFLNDQEKRGAFDRGEIDAEGRPQFRGFDGFGGSRQRRSGAAGGTDSIFEAFGFGPGGGFSKSGRSAGPGVNPEDIIADIFGGAGAARGFTAEGPAARKADVTLDVTVPFQTWARGGKTRVTLPNGKTVDVTVPAGITEGKTIRLKGQGGPNPYGGPAGDALVAVKVAPDTRFRAEGLNVRVDVPVTLYDAVLGGKVVVPTLDGSVELKIPARTTGTRTLRLKGKGIIRDGATGDLLVTLRITLPDRHDAELEALAKRMREGAPYDPGQ